MKKRVSRSIVTAACLLLGASLVQAEPVALSDSAMDGVTAGMAETSGSGGAIVGNSSEATISQSGGVTIGDSVQSEAAALNLVNSAESTVANGVNIWHGGELQGQAEEMGFAVNQANVINQEQRRSASMPNYSRPDADVFVQVERSGSETHNNQLDRDNTLVDVVSNSETINNTSFAKVDTTIQGGVTGGPQELPEVGVDTNVGKGLALAGQLNAELDGGELQLGIAVGGPLLAHADTNTSDSGYGGMEVGNADTEFGLYGRLILPELTIDINGAGCGVAMGSCESSGTADQSLVDLYDLSTIDTEVSSAVGGSDYAENSTEIYRSAFTMDNAQAEYIVVDDSSLTVNTTFTLALSGSAQSGARGMNIANSTGSAVANGVNVAKTSSVNGGQVLSLNQSNIISHSR